MRGGSSKGLFFLDADLPLNMQARESLLLRVMGSHLPHQQQIDGLGGASTNTSKIAIIKPSSRPDCDIDYTYGCAPISAGAAPLRIDWTGNCSNLTAAVGPFAITSGLVNPIEGYTKVRIWQVNLGQRIDAYVSVLQGAVQEQGAFHEHETAINSAEIRLEFLEPADALLLPTGKPKDWLTVPGFGKLEATIIDAGGPIVFVRAEALRLTGREPIDKIMSNRRFVDQLDLLRGHAAVAMGVTQDARDLARNSSPNHSNPNAQAPVLCWLGKPAAFRTQAGNDIASDAVDILAQFLPVGPLQQGFDGVGSIALAMAAAIPGTIANEIARTLPGIPTRVGHPSGTLTIGAEVSQNGFVWRADKASLSRSARCLMTGWVQIP